MHIHASTAVLAAGDVGETVAWYQTVLGFTDPWLWGDPPGFGGIRWGKGQVMFIHNPQLARSVEGHQHYFNGDELDVLYEQHRAAGAPILTPIANMPWGVREYTVRDPNGYHLRFGGSAATAPREERPPPEGVTIERRVPTVAEFQNLRREVGWSALSSADAEEILKRCLYGTVAVANEGTVGMAMAVGDGRQQIYIQDVAVRPEWHNRGVGTLLMDQIMAHLRETAPPGCWVSLFCVPNRGGFYGRFGFQKGHGMTMRLPGLADRG